MEKDMSTIDDVFFVVDNEGRLNTRDNIDSNRDADQLYTFAVRTLQAGHIPESLSIFRSAEEAYQKRMGKKSDPDTQYKLALIEFYKCAVGEGDLSELSRRCDSAIQRYERKIAATMHPGMLIASYLRKARLFDISGRHEEAETIYAQAVPLAYVVDQSRVQN